MKPNESDLIYEKALEELGEGPGADKINEQRRRFLSSYGTREEQKSYWKPVIAAIGGIVILLVSSYFLFGSKSSVEKSRKIKDINASEEKIVVQLEKGTLEFAKNSKGRVGKATSSEVSIVLTKGEAVSRVKKPVVWTVSAGPYDVTALGTVYSVKWINNELKVSVAEGVVRVKHRKNKTREWIVRASETLSVIDSSDFNKMKDNKTSEVVEKMPEPEKNLKTEVEKEKLTSKIETEVEKEKFTSEIKTRNPSLKKQPELSSVEKPNWRTFYAKEDYSGAVSAIEKAGLEQFIDSAPLKDLQAVANAARYSGKSKTAVKVFESLRKRYPNTSSASTAAFLIGRIYAEQMKNPSGAVHWFDTYLRENPSGGMAEEALGRKMDCAYNAGLVMTARDTATKLLKEYPSGPFRHQASAILKNAGKKIKIKK
ncbi:tetratricopeptide repeat protein [Myxococcota bacterium]|nr:tetratricopeptide repeat protein [Myxococcota bacterium]MBU1381016.1 tetratricopeptide repeat protein [Myxococcota bacterium]MBU1502657.1 tetratricopeptide repeat protein [bacterium]